MELNEKRWHKIEYNLNVTLQTCHANMSNMEQQKQGEPGYRHADMDAWMLTLIITRYMRKGLLPACVCACHVYVNINPAAGTVFKC